MENQGSLGSQKSSLDLCYEPLSIVDTRSKSNSIATVFRFRAYEHKLEDGYSGRSWSGISSTSIHSGLEEQVAPQTTQTRISPDPNGSNFDWGQYQDFHFVNTNRKSFYAKKDRKSLRAHVMNDLNRRERLKKKMRVKYQRYPSSEKAKSTDILQPLHLGSWSQPTLAAAPTQAASS